MGAPAYAASVRALVAVLVTLNEQVAILQGQVEAHFGRHPDAEIMLSQPGLGAILGARVLADRVAFIYDYDMSDGRPEDWFVAGVAAHGAMRHAQGAVSRRGQVIGNAGDRYTSASSPWTPLRHFLRG
jgi:hypothetical protein